MHYTIRYNPERKADPPWLLEGSEGGKVIETARAWEWTTLVEALRRRGW